ncbi:MAG: hypothetical protein R3C68_02770 [Myxococcota bacterium]
MRTAPYEGPLVDNALIIPSEFTDCPIFQAVEAEIRYGIPRHKPADSWHVAGPIHIHVMTSYMYTPERPLDCSSEFVRCLSRYRRQKRRPYPSRTKRRPCHRVRGQSRVSLAASRDYWKQYKGFLRQHLGKPATEQPKTIQTLHATPYEPNIGDATAFCDTQDRRYPRLSSNTANEARVSLRPQY